MMARTRLDFHAVLCQILDAQRVYFSPPSVMKYPCIRYSYARPSTRRADNIVYYSLNCYTVTVIDVDPDSVIPSKLEELFQYCSYDRAYTADNLNHFVYTIYY